MLTGNTQNMKKVRINKGETIYTLSGKLGVHHSTVSYWENGKRFPREGILVKVEELLGESRQNLFKDLSESDIQELRNKNYQI